MSAIEAKFDHAYHQVCVIGAGPAGMRAARVAADAGLSVLLLDEQAYAGGQIYRHIGPNVGERAALGRLLGRDYLHGAELESQLAQTAITHCAGATVWRIDGERIVSWFSSEGSFETRCDALIIATGALERPFPLPGWTLPGVQTVGGAQTLLKSAGIAPEKAVLVGCGPLLYLFAKQLIDVGMAPVALVETQTRADLLEALPSLPRALRAPGYLLKGAAMLGAIRRAGVVRHSGAHEIRIEGQTAATGLAFKCAGKTHHIETDTILLHVGVVPNIQISMALRAEHEWNPRQRCWQPSLDADGQTSLTGIFIAGDGAGIGGAIAAEHRGTLAAVAVARMLGLAGKTQEALALAARKALATHLAPRAFLDRLYPLPEAARKPEADVIVCRCEEVTAGQIRNYATLGCVGPNQTKAFGRCGMGPCQGRYCGSSVAEILADAHGKSPEAVGYYRIRSPIKPIRLEELARHDSH